jgi:acyl-CoA dehydrogenase
MSEMMEFIADSAKKIFRDQVTQELNESVESGAFPEELWQVLAESGMLSIGVPEELGGVGGDTEDALAVLHLAGKHVAPAPILETLGAAWTLAEFGKEAEPVPMSFVIGDFLTEEGSPLKLENVPWGRAAAKVIMAGTINGKPGVGLLSTDEVQVEKNKNLAGEPLDHLLISNPVIDLIGEGEKAEQATARLFEIGAAGRSAMMAGAIEHVLDLCVFYAKERQQFGRPLTRFQAIQHHIAAIAGEAAAVLGALSGSNDAISRGTGSDEVAMAKIRISEAAGTVSSRAHQLHAAIGMTYEHELHLSTRRLWTWREEYGNETYWANVLAERYLTKEESLWESITKTKRGNVHAGSVV